MDVVRYRLVDGTDCQVGDDGNVRRRKWEAVWVPLKPVVTTQGYCVVTIGRSQRSVHRLVLEAFVGPCPPGMEGCHGNGVRFDNRLTNLRWDTPAGNEKDKRAHGTSLKGERNHQRKLTTAQVATIKEQLAAGLPKASIAAAFGVTRTAIYHIAKGRNWA